MRILREVYSKNTISPGYLLLSPLLFIFSLIYYVAVSAIKFLYKLEVLKTYRSRLVTISVGNITMGGSGKTPFVEYLALYLRSKNARPAVILRGYKKPLKDNGIGLSEYYQSGDEAAFLKENLRGKAGVFSSIDRAGQARIIENQGGFDTIVLDDGFQHWRIKRDLDIVVINSVNPFGNGAILPLGVLREGLGSLKRAQVYCLTRTDETTSDKLQVLRKELGKINPDALIMEAIHAPEYFLDVLTGEKLELELVHGKKSALLAGIADPSSFERTLKGLQATIVSRSYFDDHYEYRAEDLERVLNSALNSKADLLITTEKDIVRCKNWFKDQQGTKIRILVLKIALKILKGEEELGGRLHSLRSA